MKFCKIKEEKSLMNNNYEVVKFIDEDFELEVNVSHDEETIWLSLE